MDRLPAPGARRAGRILISARTPAGIRPQASRVAGPLPARLRAGVNASYNNSFSLGPINVDANVNLYLGGEGGGAYTVGAFADTGTGTGLITDGTTNSGIVGGVQYDITFSTYVPEDVPLFGGATVSFTVSGDWQPFSENGDESSSGNGF